MMAHDNYEAFVWKEESRRQLGDFKIFTVNESLCHSPEGALKPFTVIDTRDWAMVIPLLETEGRRDFVMVKQWRHGAKELCVEFPGGVIEKGETAADGAARELLEETGYKAESLLELAVMSPNPAIMSNRIHFFLAKGLRQNGTLHLDEDEFVETKLIAESEVIQGMGKAPYQHALTAAALMYYLRLLKN